MVDRVVAKGGSGMKIAHILRCISTSYAGVPIATERMVRTLRGLGADVSIWASGDATEGREGYGGGNIPLHLYETRRSAGWHYAPGLGKALDSGAEKQDMFHLHEVWAYPQLVASKIARRKGIPYIVAPRASLEPWRMRYRGVKKKVYMKLFGDSMLEGAACLHAVTTAEVEGFRQVGYEGPAFVAHNGVIREEYENLPDPAEADIQWPALRGRRVVLYLSRLSPEKGLDQLIPAWAAISRKPSYSDAVLVLAGPDDRGYRCQVEAIVEKAGVKDSVLLPGMITGRNKLALMSRADIFTLPSYSEGFSNALLENLAAGNPVLITPGCNFPEVAEVGAGICVDPDRSSLVHGLRRLLDSSTEDLHCMGQKGRRLVFEQFTWETAARKIMTVYHNILQGKEIPLNPEPIGC